MPESYWLNGDIFRQVFQDWDFTAEGRLRQVERIAAAAQKRDVAICDFVCPTNEYRKLLHPDITVWMNTIDLGRYNDTNAVFENPSHYDFRVTTFSEIPIIAGVIVTRLRSASLERMYT